VKSASHEGILVAWAERPRPMALRKAVWSGMKGMGWGTGRMGIECCRARTQLVVVETAAVAARTSGRRRIMAGGVEERRLGDDRAVLCGGEPTTPNARAHLPAKPVLCVCPVTVTVRPLPLPPPPPEYFNCSSRESPIAMAGPDVHHLFHHPIADHSFSADRHTLAVTRDNNVDLFHKSGSAYKLQDELTGHDKTVTGVDIAPISGKIVTCSQGAASAEPSQGLLCIACFSRADTAHRPQCLRMGAVATRLEAHTSTSPHQPCCHVCALGSL